MTYTSDSNRPTHLAFGNDMSRIVRGIAVTLMVTGHSLPGKIIPFAVPLFSFLVGYGYFFAREKTLRHAAKRIWHLLSHFWLILFGICIPAAIISWPDSIKISEVLLNMFGLCGRFNFYCWYIYFYIAAMCMMPLISSIINRHGLKATIGISLFFGLACLAIYNWLGNYLTTGSPNIVSVVYRCFRYMPIVTMGYWLAQSSFFSRIPIKKGLWSILFCFVTLVIYPSRTAIHAMVRPHMGPFGFGFYRSHIQSVSSADIANRNHRTWTEIDGNLVPACAFLLSFYPGTVSSYHQLDTFGQLDAGYGVACPRSSENTSDHYIIIHYGLYHRHCLFAA